MTPKASFVIPAFNAECFLRETLDSCLDQSVKNIEVVVVNDGSKDGTRELLEFYAKKDARVVPIHLDVNVGRSEARNIGNKKARGEVLLVLDSDDKATRKRVQETLALFKAKKPDLVYGGFVTIDTMSNMERRFAAEPFSREMSLKYKTHHICHSTLSYRKGVSLNIQYQKEPYDRLGIDDWRFIWDCHLKGYKFAYTKKPLCYYRIVEGTISHTRDEKEVDKVKNEFIEKKVEQAV